MKLRPNYSERIVSVNTNVTDAVVVCLAHKLNNHQTCIKDHTEGCKSVRTL